MVRLSENQLGSAAVFRKWKDLSNKAPGGGGAVALPMVQRSTSQRGACNARAPVGGNGYAGCPDGVGPTRVLFVCVFFGSVFKLLGKGLVQTVAAVSFVNSQIGITLVASFFVSSGRHAHCQFYSARVLFCSRPMQQARLLRAVIECRCRH